LNKCRRRRENLNKVSFTREGEGREEPGGANEIVPLKDRKGEADVSLLTSPYWSERGDGKPVEILHTQKIGKKRVGTLPFPLQSFPGGGERERAIDRLSWEKEKGGGVPEIFALFMVERRGGGWGGVVDGEVIG